MAATLVGTSSGILVAEGNALSFLKQDIAAQLEGVLSYLHISADIAESKLETTKVIPTGYPPVSAIHLSIDSSSTHATFEMEAMALIRTESLRNPDRIYFDIREHSKEKGAIEELKPQKEISIDADLLSGVRIAQRKPGVTRIVLDLNRPCEYTYRTLRGAGSGLAVEIRPHRNGVPSSK